MKKNILIVAILMTVLNAESHDPKKLYKQVHDESFDAMSKVDYHTKFSSMKLITYINDGRKTNINARLIVFPDCFYLSKYRSDNQETVTQYCGAKIEGVKNKRYKNSGVDKNGYWDMRTTDDNPDNEVSFFFNFHLERDGDITFNLSRSMHANVFLFSCEQKFNSGNDGVAPNPIPVCTLEARGRKGLELEELYEQFSPKQYWKKLDEDLE